MIAERGKGQRKEDAKVSRAAIPKPQRGLIMAQKVKLAKGQEFVFSSGKAGGVSKFPWDEWLNGDLLLIEQSEGPKDDKGNTIEETMTAKKDYEVSTDFMGPKLKTAARRRYKICEVSRRDHAGRRLGNALIIRARDMTPEERVAEDILRAEEKERNALALAKRKAGENGQAPQDNPQS